MRREETIQRLTHLLRRDLKLGPDIPVKTDTVLFGGELDLDSLDALLLLQSVEREFRLKIPNDAVSPGAFQTLTALAEFVETRIRDTGGDDPHDPG